MKGVPQTCKIEKPCLDVTDGLSVCVVRNKDCGKRDIIIMDNERGARSVRSVTELANKLMKEYDIQMHKITDEVLPFVNERLRDLGEEAEFTKIGAFERHTHRKTQTEF